MSLVVCLAVATTGLTGCAAVPAGPSAAVTAIVPGAPSAPTAPATPSGAGGESPTSAVLASAPPGSGGGSTFAREVAGAPRHDASPADTSPLLPTPPELPAPAGPTVPAAPAGPTVPGLPTAPGPSVTFTSSISRIDAALAQRMRMTYHPGCPVPLTDLRHLTMTYLGFDGLPHTGEMVVAARVARDVVTAFAALYAAGFPIHRMSLVADFGGSDAAAMAADDTSAFNCRPITGGSGWSEHSYGDAVDVNPVENPYLTGETVLPPAGRAYLARPDDPGVIHPDGAAVAAFAAIDWTWGGTWHDPVDLQHFSKTGR